MKGVKITDDDDFEGCIEFNLKEFSELAYICFKHEDEDLDKRYNIKDLKRVLNNKKVFLYGVLYDKTHNILTVYTEINNPYLRIITEEPRDDCDENVEYQTSIKDIIHNVHNLENEIEYKDTFIRLLKDYVGSEEYLVIEQIAQNQHKNIKRCGV